MVCAALALWPIAGSDQRCVLRTPRPRSPARRLNVSRSQCALRSRSLAGQRGASDRRPVGALYRCCERICAHAVMDPVSVAHTRPRCRACSTTELARLAWLGLKVLAGASDMERQKAAACS